MSTPILLTPHKSKKHARVKFNARIVGVIVDVLVRGAVDVKDVGASLAGGVEPGFHFDVVVAGRPDLFL